mgnify:FL=1
MLNKNIGLVIIPTYNELENIGAIIPEVLNQDLPLHVLVVDDNSPDGTATVVKELQSKYMDRLHLMEREGKNGLGSAYIAGFKWALQMEYEWVFEMDADFSHDPKYLKEFLAVIPDHDLVLGSRYKDGKISVVNWDWKRLILSYLANIYARLVTGLPISDATGGFKCFSNKALQALNLDKINAGGYSFQVEISYRLWKKGFQIHEIPIVFVDRTVGESKMSGQIISEALFVLLKLRFGK